MMTLRRGVGRRVFPVLIAVLVVMAGASAAPLDAVAGPVPAEETAPVDESSESWTEEGAMAQARRSGEPVEVGSLMSETRRVMADPVKGAFVAEVSAFPERVKSAQGWRPVAPGLAKRADGRVAPGLSPLDLSVSGGGSGPLVDLVDEQGSLQIWWPEPLAAPTVVGGIGKSVDLKDGTKGLRYRTPGGGPGGIVDLDGNIITFWYR